MTIADDIRSSIDHHRGSLVGMCVLNAGDGYLDGDKNPDCS
jgi:hypothetical protein